MGKLSLVKLNRYERIADLLGEGLRAYQIIDKINAEWEIKQRQAEKLISETKKWIEGEHKENREKTRTEAINRYQWRIKRLQDLPQDAMSEKDREALITSHLHQIDRLQGSVLPERMEIAKLEQKNITISITPTQDIQSIERKKKIAKHYKDRGEELPDGFKQELKKYMK